VGYPVLHHIYPKPKVGHQPLHIAFFIPEIYGSFDANTCVCKMMNVEFM